MAIQGISAVNTAIAGIKPVGSSDSDQEISFRDMLIDALNGVNELQNKSAAITEDFITGRTDNIADVMIASTEAGIALDFVIEVRNKVMEAYQEIMRMQV
jgi:flagellar hook-basal body complex protein FliE